VKLDVRHAEDQKPLTGVRVPLKDAVVWDRDREAK
jgi:hypothetical protein